MPIKWSAEVDQILLLKILETHKISVNVALVAEAWPTNLERPTPRALSERLGKIRATATKASGTSVSFAISSARTTPKSTPKKKGTKAATKDEIPGKSNGSGAGKRKRHGSNCASTSNPVDDDDESTDFKSNQSENDFDDDLSTPAKKAKPSKTVKLETIESDIEEIKHHGFEAANEISEEDDDDGEEEIGGHMNEMGEEEMYA